MEVLELKFKYQGAVIEGTATAEEDYNGWTYLIGLNDQMSFRLYFDDNEEWVLLRDEHAESPDIDKELVDKIIQQIQKQRSIA